MAPDWASLASAVDELDAVAFATNHGAVGPPNEPDELTAALMLCEVIDAPTARQAQLREQAKTIRKRKADLRQSQQLDDTRGKLAKAECTLARVAHSAPEALRSAGANLKSLVKLGGAGVVVGVEKANNALRSLFDGGFAQRGRSVPQAVLDASGVVTDLVMQHTVDARRWFLEGLAKFRSEAGAVVSSLRKNVVTPAATPQW